MVIIRDIIPPRIMNERNNKRKIFSKKTGHNLARWTVTLLTIFNLVFYQSFIPWSIARAEETAPAEELIVEEENTDEEEESPEDICEGKEPECLSADDSDDCEDNETGCGDESDGCDGEDENEDNSDGAPADVSINEEENEEETAEEDAVEEEAEPKADIENENNTEMENEVSVEADTGNNQIGEETEETEEAEETAGETEEVQESAGNEEAEDNNEGCLCPEGYYCPEKCEECSAENELGEEGAGADEDLVGGAEENNTEECSVCVCPCEPVEGLDGTEEAGDEDGKDNEDNNSVSALVDTSLDASEGEEENEEEEETESGSAEALTGTESVEEAPVIETGEAQGTVSVINEANNNFTGENFVELVYNLYGEYVDDINLLEQFLILLENAAEESEGTALEVENTNEADVKNDIEISVNTGNNEINSESGEASIKTGDANATVNLVNFINQNITGNNWMFAVINVFGNWLGDLIVPGEDLLEIGDSSDGSLEEVTNENEANIANNVEVNVNTGNNQIEGGGGESGIETGDALSNVQVLNVANRNITGNNWFFLLINNMGSWIGNIFNWNEENGVYDFMFGYDFGTAENLGGIADGGILTVYNQNSVNLENNVKVNVNTGGNMINGSEGAFIGTGNASAWVNIFNFVNNNITGSNWLFGVVNIMGNWRGNLVFAYPDLGVFIDDGKETVAPGETLNYAVAYKNWGEAEAKGVEVMVSLPEEISYQSDTSGQTPSSSGNNYVWTLPDMEAGEEEHFILNVVVGEHLANGTVLETVAGIKTATAEKNMVNNASSDQTTVLITATNGNGFSLENSNISNSFSDLDSNAQAEELNSGEQEEEPNPQLEINRENNTGAPIQAGYLAQHRIILENTGNVDIYDVKVKDKIENEVGEMIVEYAWEAGDIKVGEIILVDYEVLINDQVIPGIYRHQASAHGYDEEEEKIKSNKAFSEMNVMAMLGNYLSESAGDIIPAAQAAGLAEAGNEAVLGAENNYLALPFWIWLFAALSYLLAVNWSLFPKKRKTLSD